MCGAAPDESIASYSLRSVPPGSILLLLYAMNEVVMKLAELNMLLNLRDRRFGTTVRAPRSGSGRKKMAGIDIWPCRPRTIVFILCVAGEQATAHAKCVCC